MRGDAEPAADMPELDLPSLEEDASEMSDNEDAEVDQTEKGVPPQQPQPQVCELLK